MINSIFVTISMENPVKSPPNYKPAFNEKQNHFPKCGLFLQIFWTISNIFLWVYNYLENSEITLGGCHLSSEVHHCAMIGEEYPPSSALFFFNKFNHPPLCLTNIVLLLLCKPLFLYFMQSNLFILSTNLAKDWIDFSQVSAWKYANKYARISYKRGGVVDVCRLTWQAMIVIEIFPHYSCYANHREAQRMRVVNDSRARFVLRRRPRGMRNGKFSLQTRKGLKGGTSWQSLLPIGGLY